MDLIKYEFYKEEDGAYYHFIGQLVKKVRYYREQVSINEFEAAIPELKAIEKRLQDIDISLPSAKVTVPAAVLVLVSFNVITLVLPLLKV